jgi:hypothetical protein
MKVDGVAELVVGKAALLPGEDPKQYDALFDKYWVTISPNDVFEEFWVVDLTSQTWDSLRYRRMRVALLRGGEQAALERVLGQLLRGRNGSRTVTNKSSLDVSFISRSEALAVEYTRGDEETVGEVNQLLQTAGLNLEVVTAEALSMRSGEFHRLNQMLANAETRRAATLRAIGRHREGLGAALRRVTQDFETAEIRKPTAVGEQKLAA